MEFIRKVKLVAKKEGSYTVYVFQGFEPYMYIMCTKLPNWQTPLLPEGSVGFLQYQIVKAGDKYFEKSTGESRIFQYDGVYFINFIPESKLEDNKIIL